MAIVDIRLPPTHTDEGLRAARQIRATHPDVGVAGALRSSSRSGLSMKLLADSAEGVGYLLKERVNDVGRVRLAPCAASGRRLGPGPADRLRAARPPARRRPPGRLTPREREVLELMAEGRSNQGIAARWRSASARSRSTFASIFDKLGLPPPAARHRRVLAVLAFLQS